jgi:uncharacterized protein
MSLMLSPSIKISGWQCKMAEPISSYIIKIASRCNLNCDYCYEYNMGDNSWKSEPRVISESILNQSLLRIKEHAKINNLEHIHISLHGGEPLLVGYDHFKKITTLIKKNLSSYKLDIGTQTNAVLIDEPYLELFSKEKIYVGISLDGPPEYNDQHRFYHNQKGSGKDVERALFLLKDFPYFSGILSVIDINYDPLVVWDYMSQFNPPLIDFLLPHATWDKPPKGKKNLLDTDYAKWLIKIFDNWFNGNKKNISIRTFEEIIEYSVGGSGSLETLGLAPVNLLVISPSGGYEAVDTLKSIKPGAHVLGMNVKDHDINSVINHPKINFRQIGINALSDTCKKCNLVDTCGGGYLPHRYSLNKDFDNPSVYCNDIMELINHIHNSTRKKLKGFS